MISFANLKIRTKLVVVFFTVLLPLLTGELLTLWYFQNTLQNAAELELTNVVKHLYRSSKLQKNCHFPSGSKEKTAKNQAPNANTVFLEKLFLSYRIGKTGYAFVIDTRGNVIIHPAKKGQNIFDSRDLRGFQFIKEICARAEKMEGEAIGTIRYPWVNREEGETVPRMKIVKFMYLSKWDWIVAAGAYEEEIYAAVGPVENYTFLLIVLSVFLVLFLTLAMNRFITRPVVMISKAASRLANGNLEQNVHVESERDELAILANSFNKMADQIRQETENLERLVDNRTKELKESIEKYRNLVESTVDGIVTSDRSGTITFANTGMVKMLGFERDFLVGRKIWKFYVGGIEQARSIMRLLKAEGNITNYEQKLIAKDRNIPIFTSASLLRDSEGKKTGSLGIFSDISVRKKLEKDLQKAQASIVQTMKLRALGDLVAGVAHEINNPLMASTTMLHIIQKNLDGCDTKMNARVDLLRKCNERITKIVNHLREFSRQSVMEKAPISINEPLENALIICTQQLLNMQVHVEKSFTEELPLIMGDSNYLEQVSLDLIANARDALESCECEKKLCVGSMLSELDGKPAVAAFIQDSGPGIPQNIQDKIFEPFFTTKGAGKGTGLGLSICYGIIEEHGGRIDLDSSPENGTKFTIIIPCESNRAEPIS